eukprot:gnl/Spiro4/22348_TR11003_c0_g1_i1.p1 gnl/Spiro4/22348_TR11003_c0_g1~~gnl/Spiro4/22348_TR11003_c0_g1_i1.p1  ORF type:complete len:303 (+),score=50.10 gnl/Spiro4/22348_TR11003_c0_g1_i1:92-1000(+)
MASSLVFVCFIVTFCSVTLMVGARVSVRPSAKTTKTATSSRAHRLSTSDVVGPNNYHSQKLRQMRLRYPDEVLPEGNTTFIPTIDTLYGRHVVALGRDGMLYQKYTMDNGSISEWQLMPNLNQLPPMCKTDADCPPTTHCLNASPAVPPFLCSGNPAMETYESDPTVGMNKDGRLEVFARNHNELDLWHWYQTDPKNATSWVGPRRPSCLCNWTPCANQTNCGLYMLCDNLGLDCSDPVQKDYWNVQPAFSTSDCNFVQNVTTGGLKLYFRGFDGNLYSVEQTTAGSSLRYTPPEGPITIVE